MRVSDDRHCEEQSDEANYGLLRRSISRVMRGLDPRIQARLVNTKSMDGRVKPGHDGALISG
jgi:hypothetical protein